MVDFSTYLRGLMKVDFYTIILGVENFHQEGGNIGPPIKVEFSTIFIYSVGDNIIHNRTVTDFQVKA